MVITGVADREPQRIGQLVYLDTGPLPSGRALVDFSSPEGRAQFERTVREHGDGWLLPPPPFEALGTPSSLAGLTNQHRALMEARMIPQPFRTWTQPLEHADPDPPPYRRIVILAGGFDLTPEGLRGLLAQGDPRFQQLAAPDWRFERLDTGHWPMLSAPVELGALLDRLAAGARPAAGGEQQR